MAKKRNSVPEFLQGVKAHKRHTEAMSNWLKCHGVIQALPATRDSLSILEEMMVTEYEREPGPRMDIIVRLHGRYTKLRYEVERVELAPA